MPTPRNFRSFSPSSKKDWNQLAQQELGSKDSIENLKQTRGGIEIQPYYDRSDLPTSPSPRLQPVADTIYEPRTWLNVPRIMAANDKNANLTALDALNRGATGILFDVSELVNPEVVLKDIEFPFCSVFFTADNEQDLFFDRLIAFANAKKTDLASVSGAIFWKSKFPSSTFINRFSEWKHFHPAGRIITPQESPVAEIVSVVREISEFIDPFESAHVQRALASVALSLSPGRDFFVEIAKLRALRSVWALVCRACQVAPAELFVHSTAHRWNNAAYEPHGNLLSATTVGLSAVLGGCQALTIEPGEAGPNWIDRVALNVSTLFMEEARLGKVADPIAGSYYIENLADRIARDAWRQIQSLPRP